MSQWANLAANDVAAQTSIAHDQGKFSKSSFTNCLFSNLEFGYSEHNNEISYRKINSAIPYTLVNNS